MVLVSAVQFVSQLKQRATTLALVTAQCVENGVAVRFSQSSAEVKSILKARSISLSSTLQSGLSAVFVENVALICFTA
jgi:hypothetical protein